MCTQVNMQDLKVKLMDFIVFFCFSESNYMQRVKDNGFDFSTKYRNKIDRTIYTQPTNAFEKRQTHGNTARTGISKR